MRILASTSALDQRRRLAPGRADRRDADRPRVPRRAARARRRALRALARGRDPPALRRAGCSTRSIVVIGIVDRAVGLHRASRKLATSLLASGAIAAAIIGFAARQTLANFVAGIMLAITQPIRVGDWVTFEGNYGVVEDVRLNHTILRTATEQRIVIPNEKLAGGCSRTTRWRSSWSALDVDGLGSARGRRRARDRRARGRDGPGGERRRSRPLGHAAGRRQRPGEPARSGSQPRRLCADNA